MATFSGGQANFGLTINGTPTKTNISGVATIGQQNTRVSIDGGNIGYSLRMVFANTGTTASMATGTGAVTPSAALTAGAAQIETATVIAAAGITANGNATVTITSGVVAGSPLAITVPVTTALTTASLLAAALRAGVSANAAVAAHYDVSGATDKIILTRKVSSTVGGIPIYFATDASLNIATANDTCTGITTAATSTGTLAGTATVGVQLYDADGNDWDGTAIDCNPSWFLFKVTAGSVSWDDSSGETGTANGSATAYQIRLFGGTDAAAFMASPVVFTADAGPAEITVTVIGAKV